MPPAKARNGHDEPSKHDASHAGGKSGHARDKDGQSSTSSSAPTPHHNTNGSKMRRVASSVGTNVRDSATASTALPPTNPISTPPSAAGASSSSAAIGPDGLAQEPGAPGATVQWSSFDRSVLHSYRRAYRLNTPTSFMTDYHRWVLSRPGSIGLRSPTMLRSKVFRRQGKDQLAGVVRKHFNSQGIQENDVVVDFLHKINTTASGVMSKPGRIRKREGQT